MKFALIGFVGCAIVALVTPIKVNEYGNTKDFKLIDRETAYAPADPTGYVTRTFTFPSRGPLYSNHIIKGFKHIDDGTDQPKIEITSGGVGEKHISLMVTSQYGKPLSSMFQFHGEKSNK